jgi:hypothetical protein
MFEGRRRASTEEVPTQLVCDNHGDVINDLGIDEAEDEGSRPEEPRPGKGGGRGLKL